MQKFAYSGRVSKPAVPPDFPYFYKGTSRLLWIDYSFIQGKKLPNFFSTHCNQILHPLTATVNRIIIAFYVNTLD